MAKIIVNADSARAYRRRPPDRFGSAVVLRAAARTVLILCICSTLIVLQGATPGVPEGRNRNRPAPPPAGGELIAEIARDTLIARVRWSRPNHLLGK